MILSKRTACCFILLIVLFFCITQFSNADNDLDKIHKYSQETLRSLGIPESEESKTNQKNLSEVIQAFKDALSSEDKKTNEILKEWDKYIVDITHYEEELKNTIYTEEMLFESYKKYFNMFIDFYKNETSDTGRRILNPQKKAADAILALIDDISYVSFQKTYMLKEKLTISRAKRINNELYLFFKAHELSRNFDLLKACKDLNNAVGYTDHNR